MASIVKLNKLLTQCCDDMIESTVIINDLKLEPIKDNVYKVGKALAELSELRSTLYKARPDLKPKMWGEPPSEEVYGDMFETAIEIVEEHLRNNLPEKAIETLESYVFISPHEKYKNMAQSKLNQLRQKYDL